jgi:uncharacterized membrane protein (DUF2068 family)
MKAAARVVAFLPPGTPFFRHSDHCMKFSHDRMLRLIAVFKFFKAASLIALGIGAFRLVHKDLGSVLEHWIMTLKLDPGKHFLDVALAKAANVSPAQIKKVGVGSFIYAALFLTEGMGLWLRKLWGEWLTVIITSSLVPLEIYEIHRHPSSLSVAVLALNVAIVVYLIYHMRTQRS